MTEVTVERLGHLGDGIAPGPIFVRRALPGETVAGEVSEGKIAAPKIVTPSTDRVSPPCRHYNGCGGCALQHASDTFVGNWKQEVVVAALAAQGINATISEIHTSPMSSRRRATFTGRRTKKGALVGFHAPSSDVITPVPDCRILRPRLLATLPHLERLTTRAGSRKGELRFTVTETETGLDLAVSGGKSLDLDLRQDLAVFMESADICRLTWGDEPVAERVPPTVKIGSAPVRIPPGAFLQATQEGEAALQLAVEAAIAPSKRAVDLFSGCGTFALWLAQNREVHAVEGEDALLKGLDHGWRHGTRLHDVTTERRDLFRQPLTIDDLRNFDAAVIDPPRAGAEAQMEWLAKARVPRIASVSCNPVTFARDSAILTRAGYALTRLDVVDQFRWSPHVEIVGAFSLA